MNNYAIEHTQHCDQVIVNGYTGMSDKSEGRSVMFAEMVSDMLEVECTGDLKGVLRFDKTPEVRVVATSTLTFFLQFFFTLTDYEDRN